MRGDEFDTESISFENKYGLNTKREGTVLQLLDPNMIEIFRNNDIPGVEFGDQSLALYIPYCTIKMRDLEKYLLVVIKIAEQVDRNFPLGKYEN